MIELFAGSNTILHAVLLANLGEAAPRRVAAVQLPKPIKPGSEAGNDALVLGLRTLADLARERVRRVLAGAEGTVVRCFKLAPSNAWPWTGLPKRTADAYRAQLEAFVDTLAPGWMEQGVIWEVALRDD